MSDDPTASVDRRRERGRRNREALITAAVALFAEQGYETTTVEQIATRAGVSPRTFHHNFPAKEDVLFDGYAERLHDVAQRFRASHATSLWGALAETADAVAAAVTEQPELFGLRARLYRDVPVLRATMLRINEEWIDTMSQEVAARLGADAAELGPRLAATLVNGANRAAIDTWAHAPSSDLAATVRDALDVLRPAILRIEKSARTVGADRAS